MAKNKTGDFDTKENEVYNGTDDDFLSSSSGEQPAPSSDKADASAESRIKGSKSWKPDDYNANTWSRQNLLKAELIDSSFVLRWVRDGSRSKVDKHLEDGYEFVTYKELKNFNKTRLRNGTAVDSIVRVQELVLMKLPKFRNEAKKKWLRSLQADPKSNQAEFRNMAAKQGVKVLEEAEAKELPSA